MPLASLAWVVIRCEPLVRVTVVFMVLPVTWSFLTPSTQSSMKLMATVEDAEGVVQALNGCDRFGVLLYVARTYPRLSEVS